MSSGDDENYDETSSGFFPDDLEQHDHERDLYAVLHINKDVSHWFSTLLLRTMISFLG